MDHIKKKFMAEFEETCGDLEIPLIVLPPSKPTYNGGVERGNRTFRGNSMIDQTSWLTQSEPCGLSSRKLQKNITLIELIVY